MTLSFHGVDILVKTLRMWVIVVTRLVFKWKF